MKLIQKSMLRDDNMMTDPMVFRPNQIQYAMTKDQKRAVGILSIGSFLEAFDLMLYIHMAVILNDLFFPKTDYHTSQLLAAFTFCSTFIFRPFGALFFGWIGDTIGRRETIIITTTLMAICCVVMASTPTYDDIGIKAAYIMIGCRVLQSIAAMGEIVGALLYLTELIKKPSRYFAVALIPVFCDLGAVVAILVATLATVHFLNWRTAFWVGAIVAAIGVAARTALRETPDFADATCQMKRVREELREHHGTKLTEQDQLFIDDNKKSLKKSYIALFLMECMWPMCFYFVYVHCVGVLKNNFGYSSEEIIKHNLVVTVVLFVSAVINAFLCRFFHPLIIFKYRAFMSITLFLITPFWLNSMTSGFEVGILQSCIVLLCLDLLATVSTIYPHFPVFKRFKAASVLYALSRAIIYISTSFGIVYLVSWFSNWGIFFALFTAYIAGLYGFMHFWKLEKATGDLDKYAIIRLPQNTKVDSHI